MNKENRQPKITVSAKSFIKSELLKSNLEKYFKNVEYGENCHESEGIIVGTETINDEVLKKYLKLKIISKYGVGLDNIDLEACKNRNIKVGWTGGLNKEAVAELTISNMISLCRNIYTSSNQLKNNNWNKNGGRSLADMTVGIIGVGHVGKKLIEYLKPFKCKILLHDIIDLKVNGQVGFEELLKNSDIVTLHLPLTNYTHHLINESSIKLMKPNSFLINTSRGNIVEINSLKKALLSHKIAGAALDVYPLEPYEDHELLKIPNLICTPHIAGNSLQAVEKMGNSSIQHLREFFNL
jgi:D-3-phosphoglycerate dehydrogenase